MIDVSPESLTVEATGNRGKSPAVALELFTRESPNRMEASRGPRGIGTAK